MTLATGTVTAVTAGLATGPATTDFEPRGRQFKARGGALVLTDEVPVAIRRQLGRRDSTLRDTRSPRHRIRWTADERILIAGGDQDRSAER